MRRKAAVKKVVAPPTIKGGSVISMKSKLFGLHGAQQIAAEINESLTADDERFQRAVMVTGRGIAIFIENAFAEVIELPAWKDTTPPFETCSYVIVIAEHQRPLTFVYSEVQVSQYQKRIPLADVVFK